LKYEYLVAGGKYSQLFDGDMYFIGVALSYDGKGMPLAHSVQDFLLFANAHDNTRGWTPREITKETVPCSTLDPPHPRPLGRRGDRG
jgi:hypothetical protein